MPQKPAPSSDPAKSCRGRPPKPGGRIPQVEVQRAYRARLAAAGKVVRIVEAGAVPDPELRSRLRVVLLELELREEEAALLRVRNAQLEAELKLQDRHLTNALKDNVVLKQQLADRRHAAGSTGSSAA